LRSRQPVAADRAAPLARHLAFANAIQPQSETVSAALQPSPSSRHARGDDLDHPLVEHVDVRELVHPPTIHRQHLCRSSSKWQNEPKFNFQ
jgi:hypothetical protein